MGPGLLVVPTLTSGRGRREAYVEAQTNPQSGAGVGTGSGPEIRGADEAGCGRLCPHTVHVDARWARQAWRPEEPMPDRLSPLDVSFLYMEEPTTPMHVGGVCDLRVPGGRVRLRASRRTDPRPDRLVPRYRQRVRWVPGHLANPVWVDDENFDVTYHVRRSALPRPGTDEQLDDLVGPHHEPTAGPRPPAVGDVPGRGPGGRPVRASSPRPITRWSTGSRAVDIGQVILDPTPGAARDARVDTWRAHARAVVGRARRRRRQRDRPVAQAVVDTVRTGLTDVQETVTAVGRNLVGLASAVRTHGPPGAVQPAERADRRRPSLRDHRDVTSPSSSGSRGRTAGPSTTSC